MKLLVCDVEGTIFAANYRVDGMDYASTMWQPIANSLGEAGVCRERELHDRWENQEFTTYLEWVEATCKMHRELGLTRQTFEQLLSCAQYNPGVVEFFETLNHDLFVPVLISGGFQELVRRAQRELKIPHGHGACEYFFDNSDNLLSSYSLVPCDFEGKYKYVETLFNRYSLDKDVDWIFIGDGKNDLDIAHRAPISIAFNGHQQLKDVATCRIDDTDDSPASFSAIGQILKKLTEKDYKAGHERKIERSRDKAKANQVQRKKMALPGKHRSELEVTEEDYHKRPIMHLSELLDECRVAFVGLREHYRTYREIEERYYGRSFKMIEANFEHKNNADYKALKKRDFIFIDYDCISHSQGWRIEELGVPFAKVKRLPGHLNDSEPLERVMANILYRYLYEIRARSETANFEV